MNFTKKKWGMVERIPNPLSLENPLPPIFSPVGGSEFHHFQESKPLGCPVGTL